MHACVCVCVLIPCPYVFEVLWSFFPIGQNLCGPKCMLAQGAFTRYRLRPHLCKAAKLWVQVWWNSLETECMGTAGVSVHLAEIFQLCLGVKSSRAVLRRTPLGYISISSAAAGAVKMARSGKRQRSRCVLQKQCKLQIPPFQPYRNLSLILRHSPFSPRKLHNNFFFFFFATWNETPLTPYGYTPSLFLLSQFSLLPRPPAALLMDTPL